MSAIVTLTGPSGSGKTYLSYAMEAAGYRILVSHTSRAPRPGETDGEEYHFVTREQFNQMSERREFLECVEYAGNKYGLSYQEAEDAIKEGVKPVVVVEPEGMRQIRLNAGKFKMRHVGVHLTCDLDLLVQRNLQRGEAGWSREKVWERVRKLEEEIAWGNENYHVYLRNVGSTNGVSTQQAIEMIDKMVEME